MINISERDLRDLFIYAFRYTLGRSSYSVSSMNSHIKTNVENFSEPDLELYIREITEAIDMEMCGMEMDCNLWKHTREFLQLELDKR